MTSPSLRIRGHDSGPAASRACPIFLLLAALAAAGCSGGSGTTSPEPTTGWLEVQATTTGDTLDLDGYQVSVGSVTQSLASSGEAVIPDLEEGEHDVQLAGVQKNCAVDGGNPRTAAVAAGDTAVVAFDVSCTAALFDRIVFHTSRDGDGEIFLMGTDGSSPGRLTDNSSDEIIGGLSPDGTQLVFYSTRNGSRFEIYVMNVDGSGVTQLTTGGGLWPRWSPDGSKIAFVAAPGSNQDVYTIRPDGSGLFRVTTDPAADLFPAWSPDGSRIAFTTDRDGDFEIFTIRPDGTGLARVTDDPARERSASWSPDGSKIVFQSNRDGLDRIYTIAADGAGAAVRLTQSGGNDTAPVWSPDGTEILFISNRDGNHEVYKMNADGTDPVNLTNHAGEDRPAVWAPAR